MKGQLEFFAADAIAWRETQQPGTEEKVLSRDADDPAVLTRLVRWVPGLDTSGVGVITHDYVEEVYLLEGELTDLTLGRTFRAGHYASRRPGMPHGPYRTPGRLHHARNPVPRQRTMIWRARRSGRPQAPTGKGTISQAHGHTSGTYGRASAPRPT